MPKERDQNTGNSWHSHDFKGGKSINQSMPFQCYWDLSPSYAISQLTRLAVRICIRIFQGTRDWMLKLIKPDQKEVDATDS